MLEKPALSDDKIIIGLREHYGIAAAEPEFLPIGYDSSAWVYRVQADNAHFLKVRRGQIDEPGVRVPHHLKAQGIAEVVAPLPTLNGALWASLGEYNLILYPFIDGQSGMTVGLSDAQWITFGKILRRIHSTSLPPELAAQVRRETFVPQWAQLTRRFQAEVLTQRYESPHARELAAFWREKHAEIERILNRAEALGRLLQQRPLEYVLCHADIHTANVLVDPDGGLHIVDWDQPVIAPKERDLMFVVGDEKLASREVTSFIQGYGETDVDSLTLAYYRYEWVVQEIGDFGERVFLMDDLGADTKADSVRGFRQLFDPGDVVDAAYQTDSALPPSDF